MAITSQNIGGRHTSKTRSDDNGIIVLSDLISGFIQHEAGSLPCVKKVGLSLKTLDESVEKVMESVTIKRKVEHLKVME